MVFFLFLIGITLRVVTGISDKVLWGDEWQSITAASLPLKALLVETIINAQGIHIHPPLYFAVLHGFIRMFGFKEWVFRLPSLIAGIGVLPLIYLLAKEMFGKKTAIAALFLSALSPHLIHLSYEIRPHGPGLFFMALGTWTFFKMQQSPEKSRWQLVYGVSVLASIYTLYFAWFWFLAIFLLLRKPIQWKLLCLGLPSLFLLVSYAIRFHEIRHDLSALTTIKETLLVYWEGLAGPAFFLHWRDTLLNYARTSPAFWAAVLFFTVSVFMILRAGIALFRKNRNLALFFFGVSILPVLTVAILNPDRLDARYFGLAVPFLLILMADEIFRLKLISKTLALLLAGAIYFHGAVFLITTPADALHGYDYRSMAKFVYTQASEKDVIVREKGLIDYYAERLSLKPKALVIENLEALRPADFQNIEKIWLIDSVRFEDLDFKALSAKMKILGFGFSGNEWLFGCHQSTAVVNIFVKD